MRPRRAGVRKAVARSAARDISARAADCQAPARSVGEQFRRASCSRCVSHADLSDPTRRYVSVLESTNGGVHPDHAQAFLAAVRRVSQGHPARSAPDGESA